MVRQKCIPLESPAEWKDALNGIKHSFAHTWESCYAMYLSTGFSTYLYCLETESIRVVCPISEREFDGYIDIVTPYGFSGFVGNGDYPDFSLHWKEFAKKRGYVCGYVALNPAFENSTYFETADVYQSNSLYVLDLNLGYEDLFSNLDSNRKRQLRPMAQISEGFVFDKSQLTEFFYANYNTFIRRLKASPANYFSKETLRFLCGLDNVFMVGAGQPEKVKAVSMFAYTVFMGDFLFNVPLPEGRKHAAALLWWSVNYMKSVGIPALNLGGGIREGDSLAQFKQRFGARKSPFRCLKQVYNPTAYASLCRRTNADPSDMNGYFPPYRSH
jgi:hypothetical protein